MILFINASRASSNLAVKARSIAKLLKKKGKKIEFQIKKTKLKKEKQTHF